MLVLDYVAQLVVDDVLVVSIIIRLHLGKQNCYTPCIIGCFVSLVESGAIGLKVEQPFSLE
jgi:hypothetical protein